MGEGLIGHPMIAMVKTMPLVDIAGLAQGKITEEKLEKIDQALQAI